MTRIVLAHSGGPEVSRAITWLAETYSAEVVTLTLDVGQGGAPQASRDHALAAGAVRAHVLDVRDEFAREYLLPVLRADGSEDGDLLLGAASALVRPLVARKLVDIAEIERASAVAYLPGRRTETSDFDRMLRDLSTTMPVIAVAGDWDHPATGAIGQANERVAGLSALPRSDISTKDFSKTHASNGSYRVESTVWGRLVRSWQPEESPAWDRLYALTRAPGACPNEPAHVALSFVRGVPCDVNGVEMPIVELLASLATIAGEHGVGRMNRPDVRGSCDGVYESPAGVVLHVAQRALQRLVNSEDAHLASRQIGRAYADILRTGRWLTREREALDAEVEQLQERVSGIVHLRLSKGDCQVVGVVSPYARFGDVAMFRAGAPLEAAGTNA